ncbi:hypothetical protein [Pelagibius sp.]|uniref:hypothetical protein n=1 Tax=Pelagibius sp. TaxID=1931238 RepID=UPI00262F3391|nr:hypothetical protein [Pelagibius sp.]
MRKIAVLGVGMVLAYGLIGLDLTLCPAEPGTGFYAGLGLLAVLGFFSAAWVFTGTEALTSSAVAEFPPLWFLFWVLAVIALMALLPVALIVLFARYLKAKARFARERAEP